MDAWHYPDRRCGRLPSWTKDDAHDDRRTRKITPRMNDSAPRWPVTASGRLDGEPSALGRVDHDVTEDHAGEDLADARSVITIY